MKALLTAALLLAVGPMRMSAAMPGAAAPEVTNAGPGQCALRIHATGFRNDKGFAGAAIFASPNGWPERQDKSVAHDGFPISGDSATLTFELPPGKYGVVVLHDENKNEKLDRNLLGVPTEGFGFANNPPVFLTAPSFDRAAIEVSCPMTTIDVKMIYK